MALMIPVAVPFWKNDNDNRKMIKRLLLILLSCTMLFLPISCKKKEDGSAGKSTHPSALEETFRIDSKKAGTVLVTLNRQNNYTDQLEKGYFSRSATSGLGTGIFIGRGFEFAKGACADVDKKGLKLQRWRPDVLGCSGKLFSSDWCVRLKTDHSIKYTLHFLSWTIGPDGPGQKCIGDCEMSKNQTAYIREGAQ